MPRLISFDFHNTLAVCDAWFELEIRALPARVIERLDPIAYGRIGEASITATYRALRQEIMSHGREYTAREGVGHVLEQLGIELDPDAVEATIEQLMRACLPTMTPVDGAIDAVRALRAPGRMLGVISSAAFHPFLTWTLDQFGLTEAFDFVLTSASTGFYKSDPTMYRLALERASTEPDQAVHIGDSLKWDIETPQRLGMRTIWLRRESHDTHGMDISTIKPDVVIDVMREAPAAIAALVAHA